MAHAAKILTSKAVPPHATPTMKQGKPAVKWKGRGGRVIVAALCEDTSRCLLESRKWYAFFKDSSGRLGKKPGYEDKGATEKYAVDLETRESRIASGVLPAELGNAGPLPIRLDRWRDYLVNKGDSYEHAERQRRRVELVYEEASVDRPADLTPVAVLRALAGFDFGKNSAAHYVGACKQFARWLVLRDKSETVDHLAGLSREYSEAARKRRRRALSHGDFNKLIQTTKRDSGTVRRLTGTERSLLYQLAASTGLRASELASLTTASVEFKPPSVHVAAAYSKNRRTDTLSIPDDLVKPLRALLRERKADEHLFPARGLKSRRWAKNAASMLYVDLQRASIPIVDGRGNVYDFHSLRVQFGTDLERSGASLARAQKHMRHSVPSLTANIYTKHEAESMAEDINRLRKRIG